MNLICIRCPRGCHLTVTKEGDEVRVTGNSCPRGIEYGRSEMINPERTLTTTVAIISKDHRRLPVITSKPIPKGRVMDVVKSLKGVTVTAPVHMGDVIVRDALGLGADIIASRSIE